LKIEENMKNDKKQQQEKDTEEKKNMQTRVKFWNIFVIKYSVCNDDIRIEEL
jgi:hypothetical protein